MNWENANSKIRLNKSLKENQKPIVSANLKAKINHKDNWEMSEGYNRKEREKDDNIKSDGR